MAHAQVKIKLSQKQAGDLYMKHIKLEEEIKAIKKTIKENSSDIVIVSKIKKILGVVR